VHEQQHPLNRNRARTARSAVSGIPPWWSELNNRSRGLPDQGGPEGRPRRDLARVEWPVEECDSVRRHPPRVDILHVHQVAGLDACRSLSFFPCGPTARGCRRAAAGRADLTRRIPLREGRYGELAGAATVPHLVEHVAVPAVIAMGRRPGTFLRIPHDPDAAVVRISLVPGMAHPARAATVWATGICELSHWVGRRRSGAGHPTRADASSSGGGLSCAVRKTNEAWAGQLTDGRARAPRHGLAARLSEMSRARHSLTR
jgi:hypothetical protein